jgi:adenylate cyclase
VDEPPAVESGPRTGPIRPVEVSQIAANVPFVLRTVVGTAVLGILVNVVGVVIVTLTVAAMNTTATSHQLRVVLTATGAMVLFSMIAGVSAGAVLQRRTLRWLLRGEQPSAADARRALRMPRDLAILAGILWVIGGAVISSAAAVVGQDGETIAGISGGIVIAALSSAGITYLVISRVNAPVARLALAAAPPRAAPVFGVGWRLLLIWALTSGTPIVGLVLVLTAPRSKTNILAVGVGVAIVAIVVGGYSTLLSAKSIGTPLRGMVDALHRVGEGNLDVAVQIEDAGEIGLLQSGFNDMVAGLRERERIQDLFGKHVGPAVAAEAISGGVTLSGEQRDVVALFVDIAGSTRLTRDAEPVEFVAMLNRFFSVVVDEVERNGGLVNKFEGDGALCIFGAPAELPDPASAALCTARAIRDQVDEMGELQIGIGVASGPVVAGQIGSASRLEYTVIGDAVNEAARLTDLAKRVDGRILASDSVVEAASEEEREHWVAGRELKLRGREVPTRTYRNVGDGTSPVHKPAALARRISEVAKAVAEIPEKTTQRRE